MSQRKNSGENVFIFLIIIAAVAITVVVNYFSFVIFIPMFFVYAFEYRALVFLHLLSPDDNNLNWVLATLFNHDACSPACLPSDIDWPNFIAVSEDIFHRTFLLYVAIALIVVIYFVASIAMNIGKNAKKRAGGGADGSAPSAPGDTVESSRDLQARRGGGGGGGRGRSAG